MKRIALPLAALFAAATFAAQAQDYVYMLSAGELRGAIDQGKKQMAVSYISGVMDAQMRARDFCVPADTTSTQIAVRAYTLISQQPRESMAPAADVIAVFLHGDYPCGKK
jgi:hypothetical protein